MYTFPHLDHVEDSVKKSLNEVTKKVISDKVVKSMLEKMRISGTNMWTSIADVTSSPKEVQQL